MQMGARMRLRAPQEGQGQITYDWEEARLITLSSDESGPGWLNPAEENGDYIKSHTESNCVFAAVGTSTGELCYAISLLGRSGQSSSYGLYGSITGHEVALTLNSVTPQ